MSANANEINALAHEVNVTLERIARNHELAKSQSPEDYVVLRGNIEAIIEIAEAVHHTSMFDLNSVRVSDEKWDSNGSLPSIGDDWRCVVCNRPVNTESKGVKWVHMSERGNLYPSRMAGQGTLSGEGDMGYHPVGANCARKIPSQYK